MQLHTHQDVEKRKQQDTQCNNGAKFECSMIQEPSVNNRNNNNSSNGQEVRVI